MRESTIPMITEPVAIWQHVTWSLEQWGRVDFREVPTEALVIAAVRTKPYAPTPSITEQQMCLAFEHELIRRMTFTKKGDALPLRHPYLQAVRFEWSASLQGGYETLEKLTRRYREIVKGACVDEDSGETWICTSHDAINLGTSYRRVK